VNFPQDLQIGRFLTPAQGIKTFGSAFDSQNNFSNLAHDCQLLFHDFLLGSPVFYEEKKALSLKFFVHLTSGG
jgi:hypothetical protein